METKEKGGTPQQAGRREFLKLAAASAPAVALVATGGSAAAAGAEAECASGCVRDTAHVRAYYESARF